jgi:hypothetical protein
MTPQNTPKSDSILQFNEYIKMLPSSWVFKHFLRNADASRKILSSSAIGDRIKQFSRPEAIRDQYTLLEPEQQLQCALTYLLGASGFGAPAGIKNLEDQLVRSFLVYGACNKSGNMRYFGFDEFDAPLRSLMANTIAEAAAVKTKATPIASRQGHCINDVAIIAMLAAQCELGKKKNGTLARTAVARIAKLTYEAGPHEESTGFAELLAAYGVHSGILFESEEEYRPVAGGFESWVALTVGERIADLVCFAAEFAGSWRLGVLESILNVATEGGQTAWISSNVFPEKERKVTVETLRILRWAGLVDLARAGSEIVFAAPRARNSSTATAMGAPKKEAPVVLPPDFSAVLSAECSPEQLYRFGKIGSLQSLDRVYKGAVRREIICDSLANGLDGETLMAWLAQWQAPANVGETVREWIREFNRVFVSEGPLLVATDAKITFQIDSYEPLRDLIEPLPVHSLFRIKRGAEAKVKETLIRMGLDCRMPDPDRAAAEGGREPAAGRDVADVWKPIANTAEATPEKAIPFHGKKYGTGLKALDLNETMHIIDYAILTGHDLDLEYVGSALVKKGVYTATPRSCTRGAEPLLDATLKNGQKRQFLISKISKIGVGML